MIKPGGKGKGLLIALAGGKDSEEGEGPEEPEEETAKSTAARAMMDALQSDDSMAFADALTTFIENC